MSLWKIPGRESEAESQDFPTPHSPGQLRSPSRFHQHHSRIRVSRSCPTPSSWDSSEIWVPRDLGEATCMVQGPLAHTQPWLEVRDLPPKAWADSHPIRIPGSSTRPSPEVPMNWGQGGRRPSGAQLSRACFVCVFLIFSFLICFCFYWAVGYKLGNIFATYVRAWF